MFFVYVLFSLTLNRYYIGMSVDPDERLKKHLQKHAGFIAKAKDWELVYTEAFLTKQLALLREKQIKSWKSKVMIKKLIAS